MKITFTTLMITAIITTASLAHAQTSNIEPGNKKAVKAPTTAPQRLADLRFQKGIENLLFGWTDIPRSIADVSSETKNPLLGLTAGTLKGAGKAFPRTISGVAEIVLSPMGECNRTRQRRTGIDAGQ